MKQMIAKSRKEAIAFAEGGNGKTQRAAYWSQGNIIYRAEVLPGQKKATIKENVGGYWWDAKTTIAQKIALAQKIAQKFEGKIKCREAPTDREHDPEVRSSGEPPRSEGRTSLESEGV